MLGVADDEWADSAARGQQTQLLAGAAAELTGSQWAVGVGEVRQSESGSRYVEVVFKLPGGRFESQRVGLRGDGQTARSRLTTRLLDQLRRRLK